MAQGAIALGSTNGIKPLTAEEQHEILECQKIVRFRDAIISGLHPRIQVPANLLGKPRLTSSPSQPTRPAALPSSEPKSTPAAITNEANAIIDSKVSYAQSAGILAGRSDASGPLVGKAAKSEINPILLEKSDDLIKAEIQLQRQRLERALREQIEQRRISLKASVQSSESLPDFDISEVLSQALSIVHPSAEVGGEQPVGTHTSAASDSFDENTFYSSQHDTPDLSSSSQEGREPGDIEVQAHIMADIPSFEPVSSQDHDESHDLVMTGVSTRNEHDCSAVDTLPKHTSSSQQLTSTTSQPSNVLGLSSASVDDTNASQGEILLKQNASSQRMPEKGVIIPLDRAHANISKAPQDLIDLVELQTGELLKRKFGEIAESDDSNGSREPAIIQARNELSPFAPQPARISPLATARGPPVLNQNMVVDEAPPAQVAALRKETAQSSPDSSPKGTKVSEKKKKKKKKKSIGKDSTNLDTPMLPYIKPEPLSPSPFTAAPLPRPKKRQRQAVHQGPEELNYDEPRYDSSREEQPERTMVRNREQDGRSTYDRTKHARVYSPRDIDMPGYRQLREEHPYRRVVSHEGYRPPKTPDQYSVPGATQEVRPLKAVTQLTSERAEPSRYYKDSTVPQGAVRIDLERDRSQSPVMLARRSPVLMAPPPRMAPARIVIDEYGRQYYAPPPIPLSSRQSIAPPARGGGEDLFYERAPARPLPRSLTDVYEEDGIIYRRPSPALNPPRRVVTQPELDTEYHSFRQREYSARPLANAPPDEYIQVRESVKQHKSHLEEGPRENIVRIPSARPDALRYEARVEEVPREFSARVASVRPEARRYGGPRPDDQPREYVSRIGSVHPEASRYELSRTEEVPREYMARMGSVRPEAPRYETGRAEEVPREYVTRVESVRPEGMRYEVPRDYVGRVPHVYPEPLGREYARSVRPELRRENPTEQHMRGFSARPEPRREIPVEQSTREYSVRPDYMPSTETGYSAARPMVRRVVEDVDYMERPRESHQDMYADDAGREVVYR